MHEAGIGKDAVEDIHPAPRRGEVIIQTVHVEFDLRTGLESWVIRQVCPATLPTIGVRRTMLFQIGFWAQPACLF